MTIRLPACPALEVAPSLAGMGIAGLLFFVSGLAFLAMLAAALFSTVAIFFLPWPIVFIALLAWAGLCLAAYNIVRSMELVNDPDWRGIGWIAVRLFLIALPWQVAGLLDLWGRL